MFLIIWLPLIQLWAIYEETASLTLCRSFYYSLIFRLECCRETHNKIGCLSLAEHRLGFELEIFSLEYNTLTNQMNQSPQSHLTQYNQTETNHNIFLANIYFYN